MSNDKPDADREKFETLAWHRGYSLRKHTRDVGPYKVGDYVEGRDEDAWFFYQAALSSQPVKSVVQAATDLIEYVKDAHNINDGKFTCQYFQALHDALASQQPVEKGSKNMDRKYIETAGFVDAEGKRLSAETGVAQMTEDEIEAAFSEAAADERFENLHVKDTAISFFVAGINAMQSKQLALSSQQPVAKSFAQMSDVERAEYGLRALQRNWEEDIGQENGSYHNTCAECSQGFIGHKRRVICKACATSQQPSQQPVAATCEDELLAFGQFCKDRGGWGSHSVKDLLDLYRAAQRTAQAERTDDVGR